MTELPAALTVTDVARLLRISRGSAYSLVRARTLPSVRIGRSIRVPGTALLAFLNQHAEPGPGYVSEAE